MGLSGNWDTDAITTLLKKRPLTVTFAYTIKDVLEAVAQQTATLHEYPCDVTFTTGPGIPLGIYFGEYPSHTQVCECSHRAGSDMLLPLCLGFPRE